MANRRVKAAQGHKSTKHLVPILKRAGRGIHSDDELVQDDGNTWAVAKKMRWRNGRVGHVVEVCDALNMADKYDAEGKLKSGTHPRPRITGEDETTRQPVKGLPKNFYSESWLVGLDSDVREDLGATSEVDLNIPSDAER